MLDIKFIRENPKLVQEAAKNKGIEIDINHLLEIDSKFRELQLEAQKIREERNKLTDSIKGVPTGDQKETGKKLKEKLEKIEHAFKAVEEELKTLLLIVPNIPAEDTPIGPDSKSNKEIRKWGEIPNFNFPVKNHIEIGNNLNILDFLNAFINFGSNIAHFSTIVIIFAIIFLLAISFIDIKDYRGDKVEGIKTLPTVLGLKTSQLLIGLAFLILYVIVGFLLKNEKILIGLIALGCIEFWLINRKNYQEKYVFAVYLMSLLAILYAN